MHQSYYAPDLAKARRRAIFAELVSTQDLGVDVAQSRAFVSAQHAVAIDEVKQVEREGIDKQWPPLAVMGVHPPGE